MNVEDTNPMLTETVDKTTPLKEWLVEYVGDQHEPNNGDVTVEMIIETIAKEFPEFLMVVAEENWIRGYHQALSDVTEGDMSYNSELKVRQENGSVD
jgi:hypothetical protein|tara:strand:- start:488 stop:778 length:291 start_codon:yes stop_codon:yes gene_type:complete